MPDLTIESGVYCATNEAWECKVTGSKGDVYTVKWEKIFDHRITDAEYGFTCECKAFEFHPSKECKHIKEVKDLRCGWNAEMAPTFNDHTTCPHCGGPVRPFRVAV